MSDGNRGDPIPPETRHGGHYAMLRGYIETEANGKKSYQYIFNDPGGNRFKGGYNDLSNGEKAVYSEGQLKQIGIFGSSWAYEKK